MKFEKTVYVYDFDGIMEVIKRDYYAERIFIAQWNVIVEEDYYRVKEDLINTLLELSYNCSVLDRYCMDIYAEEHELYAELYDCWSDDSETRKKYLDMLNEFFSDMCKYQMSASKYIHDSLFEMLEPLFDKEKQSFSDDDLEYIAYKIPTKLVKKVVLKEQERLDNLEEARKEYTRLPYRFYESGAMYHEFHDVEQLRNKE